MHGFTGLGCEDVAGICPGLTPDGRFRGLTLTMGSQDNVLGTDSRLFVEQRWQHPSVQRRPEQQPQLPLEQLRSAVGWPRQYLRGTRHNILGTIVVQYFRG